MEKGTWQAHGTETNDQNQHPSHPSPPQARGTFSQRQLALARPQRESKRVSIELTQPLPPSHLTGSPRPPQSHTRLPTPTHYTLPAHTCANPHMHTLTRAGATNNLEPNLFSPQKLCLFPRLCECRRGLKILDYFSCTTSPALNYRVRSPSDSTKQGFQETSDLGMISTTERRWLLYKQKGFNF